MAIFCVALAVAALALAAIACGREVASTSEEVSKSGTAAEDVAGTAGQSAGLAPPTDEDLGYSGQFEQVGKGEGHSDYFEETTPEALPTPKAQAAALKEDEPLFPFTVTGSNGRKAIFERPAERIVAYDTSAVEILFAMGEGHRVVGTHAFVFHPLEANDVPRLGEAPGEGWRIQDDNPRKWDRSSFWGHPLVVGSGAEIEEFQDPDTTTVVRLEPDFVYVLFDTWITLDALSLNNITKEGLDQFNVLFFKNKTHDFTRVVNRMRMWGRIVGNPEAAEKLVGEFEAGVDFVRETLSQSGPGPRVFLDVGNLWTAGPNTLAGHVLELLKLENIASNVIGYRQLSVETIVEKDPELIFTIDTDSITSDPELAAVSAVKNNQVHQIPDAMLRIAGPRLADEIFVYAKAAYPDLFQ